MIKWQPEWNPLLGTAPDPVLAERLGVSLMSVKRHRWAGRVKGFSGLKVVQCSWCGKDIERLKNTPDVTCESCAKQGKREANKARRKANLVNYRAYMRVWHSKMKGHTKDWRKKWEAAHPENMARYRERRNERSRAKRRAAKDKAIDARVTAELRDERARLGMEHYGWARNSDG